VTAGDGRFRPATAPQAAALSGGFVSVADCRSLGGQPRT
jgi:hypothetical protein